MPVTQEFIDSNLDKARLVDEDMRQAASLIHERLWGEPIEVASRLDTAEWIQCDNTFWYFDQLAMKYAYDTLGQRRFKHRPYIEGLVTHLILISSLSESASYPLIAGEFTNYGNRMLSPNLPHGLLRQQKNLISIRQWYAIYGRLPRGLAEIRTMRKSFFSEIAKLWKYVKADGKMSEEEKESFARNIVDEIAKIGREWGMKEPRLPEPGKWMYADLD